MSAFARFTAHHSPFPHPQDEAGLDHRRRPLDPLGVREGADAREHRVQDFLLGAGGARGARHRDAAGRGERHPHARRLGARAAAEGEGAPRHPAGHHHDGLLGPGERGERVPGRRVRVPAQAVRRGPRGRADPPRDGGEHAPGERRPGRRRRAPRYSGRRRRCRKCFAPSAGSRSRRRRC